jgi:hypothetical protein
MNDVIKFLSGIIVLTAFAACSKGDLPNSDQLIFPGNINGIVTDAEGNPINHIKVTITQIADPIIVYTSRRGEFVADIDLHDGMLFDREDFHPYPGGAMYAYGRKEGKLEALDLTIPKVLRTSRWLRILTKDYLAKQICLYDLNSRDLLVYDTSTHKMDRITTLDEEFRPYQAVLLERHVILNQQLKQQDTVRIYDRSTGKLLCSQRLEVALDEPMFHEATNTIVMVDSNGRTYFWKVE